MRVWPGPSGLKLEDVIRKINNCSVDSLAEYGDCISKVLYQADNDGWCVRSENKRFVKDFKNCCGVNVNASDLCFAYTSGKEKAFSCLSVRHELENGGGFCSGSGVNDCPVGYSCMTPMLESWEKLVQVQRYDDKDFLFIGNPAEIYNDLEVSEYIWRFGSVSWISSIPRRVERLLYFIVIVSSALGVLNAIPCWRLDGQHIVSALLESVSSRHKVVRVITHLGTALLHFELGLWPFRPSVISFFMLIFCEVARGFYHRWNAKRKIFSCFIGVGFEQCVWEWPILQN